MGLIRIRRSFPDNPAGFSLGSRNFTFRRLNHSPAIRESSFSYTHGTQFHLLKESIVLKTSSPEIIEILQKSRAKRYLGEIINANTIFIKKGGIHLVRDILSEHGYLTDIEVQV